MSKPYSSAVIGAAMLLGAAACMTLTSDCDATAARAAANHAAPPRDAAVQ